MFRRGKFAFLNTKDDRIKVVNERINLTEKHLIEMCCSFATCTGKLAKYRDSYDELAKSFKNYADDEEINDTLSEGLKSFTNATTILADYMDVQVHRLEAKIVNELALYENVCKSTRDSLRTAVITRDKEVLKQRQMLELKSKFSANNSAADSELLKAKLEVNRSNKEIDDIINNFEMTKLSDIKSILTDFVLISMKYHTKALEALSASYYDVCNIDERSDFMEFQKLMKTKEDAKERQLKKAGIGLRSQSMESLKRDSHLSPAKRRNRLSRSTKNLTGRSDDELDDDQEDDDEEDEDEEEEEEDDEDEVDSNNHDDDDSGSATEDNVKEAPSKSNLKEDLNYIKSKFRSKPLASHGRLRNWPFLFLIFTLTISSKLKQNPTTSFAAKSGGVGIPSSKKSASTTNLKQRRTVQFSDNQLETAGRLITLVESKKIKKRNANLQAAAAAAEVKDVIDCSSGKT